MSALLNDRPTWKRRHRKKRRALRLSRELWTVLDMDQGESETKTGQIERLLWSALLDEYGEDEIMAAISAAQDQFSDDALLPRPTEQSLPDA